MISLTFSHAKKNNYTVKYHLQQYFSYIWWWFVLLMGEAGVSKDIVEII